MLLVIALIRGFPEEVGYTNCHENTKYRISAAIGMQCIKELHVSAHFETYCDGVAISCKTRFVTIQW